MSQNVESVEKEMKELTASYQADKLEFIKNPVIAEFLGLSSNTDFTESELEQRIITHIQKFLMELGKGYAFVARQQHIRTEKEDYYIDLVFYNYILKCFVLIDLKTSKITHQDVGQMDMYIRMYDEMKRNEGDNPTLGIILCSDTDEDIAKYGLYLRIGKPAMEAAEQIKAALKKYGYQLSLDTPTNQIFCIVSNDVMKKIAQDVEFGFWEKYDETHSVIRFATSWATTMEDTQKLIQILEKNK